MENKKPYVKPELKCVEFEAEMGFAMSQCAINPLGTYNDGVIIRSNANPFDRGTDFKTGYFGGNNDDWD